jgi:prolyl oligopeptidase
VLIDPNGLSEDGTVSLQITSVSKDGRLVAYGLATAGSDWLEFRVRDVDTGEDRPDHLRWIKFSGASWTDDGAGFFYSRYAEPDPDAPAEEALYDQKLYYHRLGTEQDADELIYERPDHKEWGFSGDVSDDGRYLVITVWEGSDPKNGVFVKDLREGSEVVELLNDFDGAYHFVGNDETVLWFRTDVDAPKGRLIAIDLEQPARDQWRELIAEHADTLEQVAVVGERFLTSSLHHASSKVRVHSLDGAFERELSLPGIGTATGFPGRRDDPDTYFAYTSYTQPTTIYRYHVAEDRLEAFRAPDVPFDPADYETTQVFVESKDGTQIPLFLSHRKGLEPNGAQPTYLYGYGGFNIPLTPAFSVSQLVWMELGGVFAVACLRGGGEYGEEWHKAGTLSEKQNVFDDFAACAEHLIGSWTCPERLAIGGGSNGGLLVGALMTQRPELFGAALPAVGVLDMLRFHKFTIGWAWKSDYGCAEDPEQFEALFAYSPLHNLKAGTHYPATLITTGDHDDRVVPAHSFKFAAELQAAQGGPAPALIRIEVRAGHGAGKPTSKLIQEAADKWAFLCDRFNLELPDSFDGS